MFHYSGDYHLLSSSPCIDTGHLVYNTPRTDLEGNGRRCGEGIDMGAYESGECGPLEEAAFRRGDANDDSGVDISDGIFILSYLFLPLGRTPSCLDASDADDGGSVDISDAIVIFGVLFTGGEDLPAPGPESCGW